MSDLRYPFAPPTQGPGGHFDEVLERTSRAYNASTLDYHYTKTGTLRKREAPAAIKASYDRAKRAHRLAGIAKDLYCTLPAPEVDSYIYDRARKLSVSSPAAPPWYLVPLLFLLLAIAFELLA